MKKSVKDQTARAFQTGGYNPPSVPQQPYNQPTQINPQTGTYTLPGTGIAGYQVPSGGQTGYTPYGGATPYFQPVQFTGAQYQTALQTTNLPTFAETVGQRAGQYDELRTYINDAGQTLQIPFKDGRPIYPIPEGYRPIGDQPAPEEAPTTVTPVTGPQQEDTGGGDRSTGVASTSVTGVGIFSGTNFNSSSSANQAVTDAYGITGNRGINVGVIASILTGNPLGALASVSGIGPSTTAFGSKPSPGTPGGTVDTSFPGLIGTTQTSPMGATRTMNNEDIIGLASGLFSDDDYDRMGFNITEEQAKNIVDAASVLGVQPQDIGYFGYSPGDAVAGMPGAFMDKNGIARDVKTGAIARSKTGTPVYSDIKSMVSRFNMTDEEKETADREANQAAVDAAMSKSAAAARDVRNRSAEQRAADKAARDAKAQDVARAAAAAQAAKDAGVTAEQGIAGIESQGVAPGPGAPAASDRGREGGSMADRGGGPGVGGGDNADGSKGGGAVGGGCFEKGTLFKMADGTTKCVEDIKPGDKMYKGGLVYAVMQGDGLLEDWYDYKGIHVTSAHPVLDNGTWKRVGETSSKKAIDKREIYYSLMNTNHLMIAENGTEFTDFVEISADIGGRGEWMMEMLNQKQAA
jgi:hypothetical protein